MVDVLFLYPKSADLKEVEDFVSNRFVPKIKQAPGLRSLGVSLGALMIPGGPPPFSKVVARPAYRANAQRLAAQIQGDCHSSAAVEELERVAEVSLMPACTRLI